MGQKGCCCVTDAPLMASACVRDTAIEANLLAGVGLPSRSVQGRVGRARRGLQSHV
jgi:hypothetical protein